MMKWILRALCVWRNGSHAYGRVQYYPGEASRVCRRCSHRDWLWMINGRYIEATPWDHWAMEHARRNGSIAAPYYTVKFWSAAILIEAALLVAIGAGFSVWAVLGLAA